MEQITSEPPQPLSVKPSSTEEKDETGTRTPNDESPSPSPPVEVMNAFGAFRPFYELHLLSANSPSDISWIGSTQAFLMFILSAFVGPIVDAGFLRSLLLLGSLLTVLGLFMTSLYSRYWQVFLAQALTMGLGFGCLYVPAPGGGLSVLPPQAMGVSSVGSAIGMYGAQR